jgi:prepilin-type N-terminal cleavage/methylation domain-containing protein
VTPSPQRPSAFPESFGRRQPRVRRAGFTLIEVIMSLVIVGTSALGALAALMLSFRVSDSNLRALAALANAKAVTEQILTLDFDTLGGNTLPVDVPSSSVGSLTVDQWNDRRDDIHGTTGTTNDDLVMSIRPEITQSNLTSGFGCTQVVVRFRWEENSFFATNQREDSITVVKSTVPTY